MKKAFKILLATLVICLLAVLCTACEQKCADGEHSWGEWTVTTEATCGAAGSRSHTCAKCGETQSEEIPATGVHTFAEEGQEAPLCTTVDFEQGLTCKVCGKTVVGDELMPSLSHSKQILYYKAATCTEAGNERGHSCKKCGYVIDGGEEIPALGHELVKIEAKEANCTDPAYTEGEKCNRCGIVTVEPQAVEGSNPLGHVFDETQLNHFTYTECSRCHSAYKKLDSENTYAEEFVYTLTLEEQNAFNQLYEEIEAAAKDKTLSQEDFEAKCEELDDQVSYIQGQYQIARILNDVSYTNDTKKQFEEVSEFYNAAIEKYYNMFRLAYESPYSEEFYNGWTEDEIAQVLSYSETFDVDNQNEVDKIQQEYEELLGTIDRITDETPKAQLNELYKLYARLVTANNNIAVKAGYDNYMEYAYEAVYERNYTPEEAAPMRQFVRQYMGDIAQKIVDEYLAVNQAYVDRGEEWSTNESMLYYSRMKNPWMWRNPNDYPDDAERQALVNDMRNDVYNYYAFLSTEAIGEGKTTFSTALDDLFKNGNYFLSVNPYMTAYTWYIYSLDLPILNFGQGDGLEYRDPFTFVHEFGHYYQFIYNETLGVSMDQDETQSQGNEMLFLAWLESRIPEGCEEGFEITKWDSLLNMMGSIILSTAVDEFEYTVYSGATTYDGEPLPTVTIDGSTIIDYDTLYQTILTSYWSNVAEYFNTHYWGYVVFDQAGYYISYAMSALPALEIYAKASNEGLEAARASYIKLFTFSDHDEFMGEDQYGDKIIKPETTYESILNWAGLSGPFQEELYKTIYEAFLGTAA